MGDQNRITITKAGVLAASGAVDDATGQPVVVLTLRPISGWGHVNYSLHVENAEALVGRLLAARNSPLVKPHHRPAANGSGDTSSAD